jgi:class 3 adenylate cyclase
MNLFWLAHSKAVAEVLQDFFSQPRIKLDLKYQMHPFLQGVHRNALERVWARFKHRDGNPLRQNLGTDFNAALIDCIIDDQIPFTETSLARLTFPQLLVENNKRFRLNFREFREMHAAFRERLRDVLRRKDSRMMEMFRRWLPGVRSDAYDEERSVNRLLFNSHVVTYLLAEFAGAWAVGFNSPVGRLERATHRAWGELVLDYLDLLQAVKRSEVVDLARQAVGVVGYAQSEVDSGPDTTRRLFPSSRQRDWKLAEDHGGVRRVWFTATSEGGVAEQELAPSYVFDQRHCGTCRAGSTSSGDGAMMTFGFAGHARGRVNALRTALAIQELMAGLRADRRTDFTIGISVHTGRAQVAHFVLNDRSMDRTVIGRNVNIAGRLSTGKAERDGGRRPGEDQPQIPLDPSGARREVWVDGAGVLYNTGIVVSQDTVEEVVRLGMAEPWARGGVHGYRFFDEALGKNVLLEYVGDARFKGVGRSIAIYRLGTEPAAPGVVVALPQERG